MALYNIIGDIHGRTSWKDLVREDCINIFIGDYFSPYHPQYFEDLEANFKEILKYKEEHPETVLLLGNHDVEGFVHEAYSRHDYENENTIRNFFAQNEDLFQIAYAIDNKVLVTHAGLTDDWYSKYKYHTLPVIEIWLDNPNEVDNISDAYKKYHQEKTDKNVMLGPLENLPYYSEYSDEDKEWMEKQRQIELEKNRKLAEHPLKNTMFFWKGNYYFYDAEKNEYEKLEFNLQEIANFINKLWKDKKYASFSFDANAGHYDCYGESTTHGPLWIRPAGLHTANLFKFSEIWQVVGHTMQHQGVEINNGSKICFVDCLEYVPMSLIYDSETGEFKRNHKKEVTK